MPMFVHLDVDADVAGDKALAAKLVEVCPVNIFEQDADGKCVVVEENEDECVLCDLCVQAAAKGKPEGPSGVRVIKLYE